ncbi:MAG: AAA family ATPase [Candidatus Gracilibacteria bacterium]|nr:AAA family ATPase [Candidatus Gracilibacteria bacterium]
MIKKISKINNLGKFTDFSQDKIFIYGGIGNNCNIIFGFNGSGKTTISNILGFFSDNSFITEDEKEEIFDDLKNNNDSKIELELQTGNINYPATHKHSKEFYVFNSNFISNHVFDGTNGKIKKFNNISAEITNKDISNINEKILELNEEIIKIDNENNKLENLLDEITKLRSSDFSKILTDKNKRLSKPNILNSITSNNEIIELNKKIDELKNDYELSKKQSEIVKDIEKLGEINFEQVSINIEKSYSILGKNIQQLSKEILENKIKEVQNLFIEENYKESVERWFKFGKNILEIFKENSKEKCPLCNSDISNSLDTILNDYQGYFDKKYEEFIKEINIEKNNLSNLISLIKTFEENYNELNNIKIKYEKNIENIFFEKFDFHSLITDLDKLKNFLEVKNTNIQKIDFEQLSSLQEKITKLNLILLNYENYRTKILKVLNDKKLDTGKIEDKIREVYKEIIIFEFNKKDKSGALEKYKNNINRKKIILEDKNDGLIFWKNKLLEELKKIKTESKSISKYLGLMGITHFDIDINENNEKNIIIKYKNSNLEKNKLRNNLSEGEKTALAFSYFLSKFENEVNTEDKIKKSIIILDDPISSLDENRLYTTAYLIKNNFENTKQIIVLSHNFLFLKFLNSCFKNSNCLFLKQNKLSELPKELQNFETPYFFMLQEIIDFSKGDNEYAKCYKYLPNYTRRVLETFLSFKFAKIISSKNPNQSPGLENFDENIKNSDFEEITKEVLKTKINEIKNISDKFSHGNTQHLQESFYISEEDLKNIVSNTLFIIENMDSLHKTSFENKK